MTAAVARMTEDVTLDLKRITAEVAARHGMLVRPDDPAMLLVTMNEVVLEQVVENIEGRVERIVAGIEAGFLSAQREALGSFERAARIAGIAVREEIQKDVEAGRLHARELIVELNSAYSRSAVRRWVAVGMVVAGGLLLLGVGLGVLLARVWK
jgi:Transcriptional activator TraM